MEKIVNFIENIFLKILEIIGTIVVMGMYAIVPAFILYAGNQTSNSRIRKFGAESPQGIEATRIAIGIDIVCGIILGILAIVLLQEIIDILSGKKEKERNNIASSSSYDYDIDIDTNSSRNNNQPEKSFDFDIKTSYVTDNFGNIVGKVQTTTYEDKYGGFEKKEMLDNFGNKKGEVDTYKW